MSDRPKAWMGKIRDAERAGNQKLADELYDYYWAAVDRERAEAREACEEIERNNARLAEIERHRR